MKRFTAEEVATLLAGYAETGDIYPGWTTHAAYEHSRDLVRKNLIPQWQDEPDEDGWYWVEGDDAPLYHYFENGYWRICGNRTDGSRVCPVGARPS